MNTQERLAELEAQIAAIRSAPTQQQQYADPYRARIDERIAAATARIAELDAQMPGATEALQAAAAALRERDAEVKEAQQRFNLQGRQVARANEAAGGLRRKRSDLVREIEELKSERAGQDRLSRAPVVRSLPHVTAPLRINKT
jgi:chromosome segregation ATPase